VVFQNRYQNDCRCDHISKDPAYKDLLIISGSVCYFQCACLLKWPEALTASSLLLQAGEATVITKDETWPLLLRVPVQSFEICMGIGSQAVLWKNLATAPSMKWTNIFSEINEVLWCVAAVVLVRDFFVSGSQMRVCWQEKWFDRECRWSSKTQCNLTGTCGVSGKVEKWLRSFCRSQGRKESC
jgi:hypothetical protein